MRIPEGIKYSKIELFIRSCVTPSGEVVGLGAITPWAEVTCVGGGAPEERLLCSCIAAAAACGGGGPPDDFRFIDPDSFAAA